MTRQRGFLLVGLLVALLLAGGVSYFASSAPDGLNRVAADHGLDRTQEPSGTAGSPLAGYGTEGVHHAALSGAVAGVVGVGLTLLLAGGLFLLVRRRGPADEHDEHPVDERV